jgi:hypothetical protein
MFIASIVLPVFVSMDLVAAERARGTLRGLCALPVQPWKILAVKTLAGLALVSVPVLVTFAVVVPAVGGREISVGSVLTIYAAIVGLGMVIFFWTFSFGLLCRSEEKVGLVGAGILLGCFIHAVIVDEFRLDRQIGEWVWSVNPFSIIELLEGDAGLLNVVVVQTALVIVLCLWAKRRFRVIVQRMA